MDRNVSLAVDIGGTFTDVVVAHGEQITTTKVLTTYPNPSEGFLAGVSKALHAADLRPAQVGLIIHGTTLATNALIERRGAKTAFLTTAGHRDVLAMAYENRFDQYDLNIDRPEPLVPRYLRLPITERVDVHGDTLVALDEESVRKAADLLSRYEIESVAIGYLHGYANPAHEERTAEILSDTLPGVSMTLASEVCPEIREYERFSTACANAYVRPLMDDYLQRLKSSLQDTGFDCSILMMTSGGGLTTLDTAAKFPIRLVESGPAGGAILAQSIARECDASALLSFDMGGTTAKLCLIDEFEPQTSRSFEVDRVYRFKKGSGLPVRIPVIEMVEIGAGGGSIAWVDRLGRIQTGPESAGSQPGPAAFGRGGQRPTITDADVVLGKVVPEFFAGGDFELDFTAADQAIARDVGGPLDLEQDMAALGIAEVVDESMASAARTHAIEGGHDIATRAMVAFGGAAPLHAARLAEKLGIDRVIIPSGAGVGSAIGFLLAPISYEVVRSRHMPESEFEPSIADQLFDEMYCEAFEVTSKASPRAEFVETRQVYMRYRGQGHEIAVDVPNGALGQGFAEDLRQVFDRTYANLYGRTIPALEVEILTWTLTLKAAACEAEHKVAILAAERDATTPKLSQAFFDPVRSQKVNVPVYERAALDAGMVVRGPALIAEEQTTTVVTSSFHAIVNSLGHIELLRNSTGGSAE